MGLSNVYILCVVFLLTPAKVASFVLPSSDKRPTISMGLSSDSDNTDQQTNRRDALRSATTGMMALLVAPTMATATEEKTIWLTGKAPKVPGQKPKDKGDYSGTKKDPNFLRSISDCKNQCEKTLDADGLAKSKDDCLSECQDICCTTYEQCTFAIVPRI